jgi:hypothetical protein
MDTVCCSHACHTGNDQPQTEEEAMMIGDFLQDVTDYNDIWSDIGPSGRLKAQFDMNTKIRGLNATGWLVYATQRTTILRGQDNKPPINWDIAYILVLAKANATVTRKDDQIESLMSLATQEESEFTSFIPIMEPRETRIKFI